MAQKGEKRSRRRQAPTPPEAPPSDDTGAETQRNFRYQHAYTAILLIKAVIDDERPVTAVYCEHHEDILVSFEDKTCDAYQVKTRQPEDGKWHLKDEALRKSLARFVALEKQFPDRFGKFHFVSNAKCSESQATDQIARSPSAFQAAVAGKAEAEVDTRFRKMLTELCTECDCSATELATILSKVVWTQGPGRDSFDDELSHRHVAALPACKAHAASELDQVRDALIQRVSQASSLKIDGPRKHWAGLEGRDDPTTNSKQILPDEVHAIVAKTAVLPFALTAVPSTLDGGFTARAGVVETKLRRAGLEDMIETLHARALAAEGHLLRLGQRGLDPERARDVVTQLTTLVRGACDDALVSASLTPEPFGRRMYDAVQQRLRRLTDDRSPMIAGQEYECLVGVAGLLTGDCTVWWSSRFDLGAAS